MQVLLAENGIEATGDLSTFPAIGDATAVANLIVQKREKETQNQGARKMENVSVSPDGKTLTFRLKTEVEVQKPELLMEQLGVSELFRITVAKASLESGDGNLMGKSFCISPNQEYVHVLTYFRSLFSSSNFAPSCSISYLCECTGARLQQWARWTSTGRSGAKFRGN